MVSPPFAVAMLALFVSLAAVEFSSSLNKPSTTTPGQAVQDLLPLAAIGALLTAIAGIYRQLHHHAAAAAAGTDTEVAAGVVCVAVGLLQFLLHDDDTRPRALGSAAVHVLPAAAAATFFLGMALVFVHGSAAAGDGPVQTPVWILTKVTLGAAAGVVGLMALPLYTGY